MSARLHLAATHALQVNDFTFMHIGIHEGLLSQRVYSIGQMADGTVWWTTKRGVSRWNGTRIFNYELDEGAPYSSFAGRKVQLAHSVHSYLAPDSFYTYDNGGRIYRYNATQNRFDKIVELTDLLDTYDVVLNDVFIADDCMWLAMREGLYLLKDNRITPIKKGFYANCIIPLYPTQQNRILVGSQSGVWSVDVKSKTTRRFAPYNVESGYYDEANHTLWLGTFGQGLVQVSDFQNNSAALDESHVHAVQFVPNNPIRAITPYDDNTMLIGIDGFGVYQTSRHRPHEGKLLFDSNEGPCGVLHGNGVYAVLVDSWRNILIGTYSGGIDIARPVGSTTAVFQHTRNNLQSLINDHVNCVMQWTDDLLLMGTDDGVSIFNSSLNTWQHVCRGMVVLDVCKTPDGRILLATYGNGVCEVGTDGTARQLYSVANGVLTDDHVYKLLYDRDGHLWIGSLSGQLVELAGTTVQHYDINNVQSILQIPDGKMAVGTAYGLFLSSKTDRDGKRKFDSIHYYPDHQKDANWFILDLYSFAPEELWMATDGGGVYRYNTKTKHCKQISTTDGLPSNSVYSIACDTTGRLWFGTENGLAFIDINHPEEVFNVSYCYGLEREYVRGAVANLSNGNMLYGSAEGAVIINPRHIQRLNYTARLHILYARCSQDDDEVLVAKMQRMLEHGELRLSYSQRTFEVFYEGINLRNQFDIAYQYKTGDSEWSSLTTNQSIRFENIEPGTHDLHIRLVSKTSGIVLDERTLHITVSQPWWNSWWMWCIYLAMLTLAFVSVWQVYQLHSRYMRLVESRIETEERTFSTPNSGAVSLSSSSPSLAAIPSEDIEEEEEVTPDNTFVETATQLVLDHLSNPDFTIDSLCRDMAMSRTLFYVKLKSYTGKSPQDFIRVIRLERASSLLRQGHTVTDVSILVGFDNPKYFSTVFKKYFGVSPSKYK